jgi:Family of unknown function (DUF6081)
MNADLSAWQPLVLPAGENGEVFRYEEPEAKTTWSNGTLEIWIGKFTRSHDLVQNFDNGKHLLLAPEPIEIPALMPSRFSIEMAAENLGGNPLDYRDGFLTFNVLDLDQALALDAFATGQRLYSFYERLFIPGITTEAEAFTRVVDTPLFGVRTRPGEFHRFEIEVEPQARRARWFIDDVAVFTAADLPVVPRRITLALGLLTLHSLEGHSVSLRGQGMIGRWRNLGVKIGRAA